MSIPEIEGVKAIKAAYQEKRRIEDVEKAKEMLSELLKFIDENKEEVEKWLLERGEFFSIIEGKSNSSNGIWETSFVLTVGNDKNSSLYPTKSSSNDEVMLVIVDELYKRGRLNPESVYKSWYKFMGHRFEVTNVNSFSSDVSVAENLGGMKSLKRKSTSMLVEKVQRQINREERVDGFVQGVISLLSAD